MARLTDLPPSLAHHLAELDCATPDTTPWAEGPALSQRRVAVISTAGLQRRGEASFALGESAYRVLDGDLPADEIVMSHISTNFDRTGFQQDLNVVFPLERLRELAARGVIGSVAQYHYAFMGATAPEAMAPAASELTPLLRRDGVDAVLLAPV